MKVDSSIKKLGELPLGDAQSSPRGGPGKARASTAASERVQISPRWSAVKAPTGQVAPSGAFDASKVEQIKLAISEGRLEVSPEKIADGLVTTVMDLLRARRF